MVQDSHAQDALREAVRKRYGDSVTRRKSCCGGESCEGGFASGVYSGDESAAVPEEAAGLSFGCGSPTRHAGLHDGEVVLDLGCGAGTDLVLAAGMVGPRGLVYGLDMTDEMLEAADRTAKASGFDTIRLLKGVLERIPLADGSVDAIISNCVINLAGDKAAVLREALRVLRPGGRLCVADTTFSGSVPDAIRSAGPEAWCG
mgnify:FL=1